MRFRRLFLAAAVAACLASQSVLAPQLATAQNLPNLGGSEREDLSPLMERKLGEQIMRDIRRDNDYLNDAPTLEYLNGFGNSLVEARPEVRGEAGFDFLFFAVRDPALNAFALPGGFIGVYSGLMLAAQSESELASVLAHEIGHVSQRHIARMLGSQKQDMLIPLAAMVLGALAARSSPDLGMATMMGGQGYAMQRQLNFSRDAEREADRVGLQILGEGGFDTSGMVAFFGRLQTATRAYSENAPAYLQSHPLTTERIADIQARIRDQRYRQRADSIEFQLIRARVRVLQDPSAQGLREAAALFESQLQQKSRVQTAAAKYGLAFIALKQGKNEQAQALLEEARTAALKNSAPLAALGIEARLAAGQPALALKEAQAARTAYPLSRGFAMQYADALTASGKSDEAVRFLRDQSQLYRSDVEVQQHLASAYAAQGKQALQHMALAEAYALNGALPAALDQLGIARKAPDASFYDQSIIDAREREFQERRREELKESREARK
ncbi:beta-barrel assembly-enhancing protease [Noviherbaspirillum suwonense]|uniref:Zn-dependent protease, contains TPR repeats n=1 Tax=Noviherbaspirillum suwonense TaxID=1224511 RepID=A0ABY1PSJ2_9BURK|nr:M48 family metalloprotease [Noviherbaspirillum suwonense]SMP44229.1 Putative Zn-dependent protease, contains TPR repeats [Noviherbaspirillum suwonense]